MEKTQPASDLVERKVIEIIADHVHMDASQVKREMGLETDLAMDSLDRTEVAMKIEDNFEISIPDDAAQQIRTVDDVINAVIKHA